MHTHSHTKSETKSATKSASHTLSASKTPTDNTTVTFSGSSSKTSTDTKSLSHTSTPTDKISLTSTDTKTPTHSGVKTSTSTTSDTLTKSKTKIHTPSKTDTRTATGSHSSFKSETSSSSKTATVPARDTQTFSKSVTRTPTSTKSESATLTLTQKRSLTRTDTKTATHSKSISKSATPTEFITATGSKTKTSTHSESPTDTRTKKSPTDSKSVTKTLTQSDSSSKTSTSTEKRSLTPTHTKTSTDSSSDTRTPTLGASKTSTKSELRSHTLSKSDTYTLTSSKQQSATPTSSEQTYSRTPTHPYSITASSTETDTYTRTVTDSNSIKPTDTNSITSSSKLTYSDTLEDTSSVSNTDSVTETESNVNTRSATEAATYTRTATGSNSIDSTDSITSSSEPTYSDTLEDTLSASNTDTITEEPTNTESISESYIFEDSDTLVETETYLSTTNENDPMSQQNQSYVDVQKYRFEDIDRSKFLTSNVSDILNTSFVGDPVRYLEFQGAAYIRKDFANSNSSDLNQIYLAKKLFIEAKNDVVESFKASQSPTRRFRKAKAQDANSIDFRTLDMQPYSDGLIAMGPQYNWCTDDQSVIAKIRFSSSFQYDLACITSSDGQIYLSAFDGYSFADSYRIDRSFSIIYSSTIGTRTPTPISISAQHADMDFRESYFFGDFDGDGKDEIGVSHANSENVTGGFRVYKQETSGNWVSRSGTTKEDFCTDARSSCSIQECGIRVGDFDGDGDDDLWCHDKTYGINQVLFSNTGLTWYIPDNFSLDQQTWCQGGYVQVKDFDGDAKSDAICLSLSAKVMVLYSRGDGSFVSKSGFANGDLNLGPKLGSMTFNLNSNSSALFREPSFVAADFNGDGYGDLWSITSLGVNKFLLGNSVDLLSSSTSDISGAVDLKPNMFSWCQNGLTLSADFNGDKKDDLFCNGNADNFFMSSFINGGRFDLNSTNVKIRVTDYNFSQFEVTKAQFKTSLQEVVCNNNVRPDDKLKCEAKVSNQLQRIKDITTDRPWARVKGFAYTPPDIDILHLGEGGISYMEEGGALKEQKIYINYKTQGDDANLDPEASVDVVESSLSTDVKSGEGIKMTMSSVYVVGALIPYRAIGYFTATDQFDKAIIGRDLLVLAQNVLIHVKPQLGVDSNSITFELCGHIKADLMYGTNNLARNDNILSRPTYTRTRPTVTPRFTYTPEDMVNITATSPTKVAGPTPTTTPATPDVPSVMPASSPATLCAPSYVFGAYLSFLNCTPTLADRVSNQTYVLPIGLFPSNCIEQNMKVCAVTYDVSDIVGPNNNVLTSIPRAFDDSVCITPIYSDYNGSGYESSSFSLYHNDTGAQIKIASFSQDGYISNDTDSTCSSFASLTPARESNEVLEEVMLQDVQKFQNGTFYLIDNPSNDIGIAFYENVSGTFLVLVAPPSSSSSDPYVAVASFQNQACDYFGGCVGVDFNGSLVNISV